LQAADGEWWIPSVEGLRRYPKVANFSDLVNTPPKKVYTTADGLFGNGVFAIFEDSRGDIWISTSDNDNNLVRFERATEKIYQYTTADGLPEKNAPISFGEDAAGNIWISFYLGELYRYKDGKFCRFTAADGIPKGLVSNMLSDKKGRFWLAMGSRGLFRIDNPYDDAPKFVNFSTAEGLSSNRTLCLTEDDFGRIYVGTGRGINRLEPEGQRVKIFTQADGLPGNIVSGCGKSSDGKLWFTSNNSLIQFAAQADAPAKPPPIFIDSLSINGVNARNISEFGETEIKDLEFSSDEKQIQIGFFAISLDKGEALRYQYKLEGQDWSQPDEQRTISLNLSSGTYNFQVQAVNSDGIVSEKPATISFRINPPFWQNWWFLILSTLAICSILYSIYQYRTNNLLKINAALTEANRLEENLRISREERIAELQRVRTRIATDLHDDIGSSLTQIAVLTEVARRQANSFQAETLTTPLERIKNVSKELVGVMSDVVWAINPQKDFLQDLVQRMRRFASDVFSGRGIKFEFTAPEIEDDLQLGANIRREVFAIFKESVNNSVKYSECTAAAASFRIEENRLFLEISDNGKGFETQVILSSAFRPEFGGNGLINMRRRAEDLGGICEIFSEIGQGTTVKVSVPLHFQKNG
jgi:signal transduction histidine kinase/streptogramin lyase